MKTIFVAIVDTLNAFDDARFIIQFLYVMKSSRRSFVCFLVYDEATSVLLMFTFIL